MSEPTVHPSPDELSAFSLGKLSEVEAAPLENHISNCEDCCDTLLGLVSSDTFVDVLQVVRRSLAFETLGLEGSPGGRVLSLLSIPEQLAEHPRYEIQGLIGRGGMGHVFRARHRLMERTVALKVIHPQLISKPAVVDRFHREVKAAARLSHPHIVTAHDADSTGSLHFLVMEFVDGVNLDQLLCQPRPLSVELACDYIRQAAAGLQHAYELGMVHRDIKPHNLMLTRSGEVKILDFGLACLNSEVVKNDDQAALVQNTGTQFPADSTGSSLLTQAGSLMGTPDFMAPEQAIDAHSADIRADIYSLGCTFYTLLAGRPPFADRALPDKVRAHAEETPRSLTALRNDVPNDLALIVAKMMAKDPEERYQAPHEITLALAPFIKPPSAGKCGERSVAVASPHVRTSSRNAGPPASPRGRLRGLVWIGWGILLVGSLFVLRGGQCRQHERPPMRRRLGRSTSNRQGIQYHSSLSFAASQALMSALLPPWQFRPTDGCLLPVAPMAPRVYGSWTRAGSWGRC